MRLFSYCLRYDDGAAPNPFWELCTLAICKPVIRRAANIGDWVIGLGSTQSPIGNINDCIVYAMQVTDKMTLRKYDEFCRVHCPHKIPKWNSEIFEYRVGDCIYDYSQGEQPVLRPSVHDISNQETDLGGINVLMSRHFYYFGDKPVHLPDPLTSIVHKNQGHKSTANQPYVIRFVTWINNLGYTPNQLHGQPQLKKEYTLERDVSSCRPQRDRQDDKIDKKSNC
ncbi:hypothetical protein [Nostoc sp. LEGE 12450]|uniref:Nmad2 family putative nucleotide modification protein n=1 Tax=Nostoc sp. LEGE 12450 TaxID=1828643 RepID=UPI00187FB6B0|nr:hypothetical protein [Nostoc sp. LEGE 12450]MBE8992378.1 hypothetical protein [Nostoc sp. LEGE 12450]